MAASMIDITYLKELLEIFDASSVHDLRIEQEGVEIKLSKSPRQEHIISSMPQMAYAPMQMQAAPAALPHPGQGAVPQTAPAQEAPAAAAEPLVKHHEIRSPIVGTFYRASSPESPVYVEVGQAVSPGMVLCIVEAMKLMNEIECDAYGKIAKILIENGQPVEYNQLLFLVEQE
jgi:acetyl-CoA carboxylase biotin carboxyl carrier protein